MLPLDPPDSVALPPTAFPPIPVPVSPDPLDEFTPVPLDAPLVSLCPPVCPPPRPAPLPYALSPFVFVSLAEGVTSLEGVRVDVIGVPPDLGALPALVPVDVLTTCVFGGMVSGFCTVVTCSFGDQAGSLVGTISLDPEEAAVVPSLDPGDDLVAPLAAFDAGAGWAAARAYACQRGFSPKIMNHA